MAIWGRAVVPAIALTVAALVGSGVAPVLARDHDEARHAVEAGEIRPLAEILNVVRGKLPGEVVRVKLERKTGHWVYEFRVVNGEGRVFEVYVNARSGDIERTKEK